MDEQVKWLSSAEAAEAKGVSRQAVTAAAKGGKLVARRVGKYWWTTQDALEEWQPVRGRGRKKQASDD